MSKAFMGLLRPLGSGLGNLNPYLAQRPKKISGQNPFVHQHEPLKIFSPKHLATCFHFPHSFEGSKQRPCNSWIPKYINAEEFSSKKVIENSEALYSTKMNHEYAITLQTQVTSNNKETAIMHSELNMLYCFLIRVKRKTENPNLKQII